MRSRISGVFLSIVVGTALALCIGCVAGALSSDPTAPTVELRKFERTPMGTQGAQTWIPPGGSGTVPRNWPTESASVTASRRFVPGT